MYYTLKKLGVTFILLNILTFQSLMADMMFYYSAAILPSIVASQQQSHAEPIANHDEATSSELVPVTVDVLENDIIDDGLTVTVQLGEHNPATDSIEYFNEVIRSEGIWSIESNQSVTFTPSPTYSGGGAHIWYQITDHDGHSSENDIFIDYPILLGVDYISMSVQDTNISTTIDVLAGITIESGVTVQSLLIQIDWDHTTNTPIFGISLQLPDGDWAVIDNKIVFTPNPSFAGGSVQKEFQITDSEGRVVRQFVEINYPTYLIAVYDERNPSVIEPILVNVLGNDTVGNGLTATVQLIEYWDANGPMYVNSIVRNEGIWTIEVNQSVTFTPNVNFSGGDINIEYGLTDQDGHASNAQIYISFPIVIQANYDSVELTEIAPVTVDVLANDILQEGATLTSLLLQTGWDFRTNISTYGTSFQQAEGNWTIVNNEIVFTPGSSFAGGYVNISYQILDDQGHIATTSVSIHYPEFLRAEFDEVVATDVTLPTTVNVLANDFISDEVTFESVWLSQPNFETQQWLVATSIETNDGNWTVVNNEVVFTPNANFAGGIVYINYQLRDDEGHITTPYAGYANITYPLVASPICSSTIISDLSALYNLAVSSTEDDEQHYVFADALFTDTTPLLILNPMYFEADYEEQGPDYVKLRTEKITFFDNNNTWTFDGQKVTNDHGVKNIESESDSGDYSIEGDGSYLLTMDGEPVFNPKAVQEIALSDLVTMYPNLTLTVDDTAQLILTKDTGDRYWWDGYTSTESEPAYANLNEYILTREYNSSNVDYRKIMLNSFTGFNGYRDAGITFAAGSSEVNSGTLVEINIELNTLLTETAGTWSIESITDEGNTYDILILEPVLCGYERRIYKLEPDGNIYSGGQEETLDEIGAEIIFNESFNNKMEIYFIENAPLDINKTTP